ncbi:MAG TPA: TldD/PmbA family protein [candidate division WOR-3 bacterium]|uniref:TldD/PmbA family protein n=1 Tax=candidate division WOR-3 bacterium TaxID=2052148 RepID=A0A7V0T3V5_UNCW3|nr:TldD/PmbA family protein [candidate division WOR-3 bacterium]
MERLLEIARRKAYQAEVFSQATVSDGVSFENGKFKDVESSMLSGVGLLLLRSGRLGMAYTRNLVDREELVSNALAALAGGVEADYELAPAVELPGLDTYDPAIEKLDNAGLVAESNRILDALKPRMKAQLNVSAARSISTVRVLNSAGFDRTVRSSSYHCYFAAYYPGSYASVSRYVTGKDFRAATDEELEYVVATYNASEREVKAKSGPTKALFLPMSVYALIWRLTAATTGRSVYEKVSPLREKVGEQVLSPLLTLTDAPLDDTWPGARSFDDEGTPCMNRALFERGVLRGFYTDRYYAWKLGTRPTGNGWRSGITSRPSPDLGHLRIEPGRHSLAELLKEMGTGVIVAGVLGAHSGNILNGDYSIGLSPGLWVENGEIAGHVKDAMVAGNVYEDLKRVVAVGDRLEDAHMGRFPALLLDGVNFATRG